MPYVSLSQPRLRIPGLSNVALCRLVVPNVSTECITFIFKVRESNKRYSWTVHLQPITSQKNGNFDATLFLFRRVCKIAKKTTISFIMSARPYAHSHGTTRLPLDEISLNTIFECFSKICREYSRFIKI